ncbi:hypothetical protein [Stieleria mannarensis]|uniref:hypothetical protein n=1 Tax=Stieleria mannarensis TaxID=2755585 RepID=UPI001603E79A|nr:hypothetical protein [Rhodopirellula sp. JC639]
MRGITILMTMLVTSAVGAAIYVAKRADDPNSGNTYFTDIASTRDRALLDQFMASLDPTIMKECAARYDSGRPIDLDYLVTCGDFETYARYLRLSKFDAVKKFEHALLYSSSKLEFEDRLAR